MKKRELSEVEAELLVLARTLAILQGLDDTGLAELNAGAADVQVLPHALSCLALNAVPPGLEPAS